MRWMHILLSAGLVATAAQGSDSGDAARVIAANMGLPAADKLEQVRANCHNSYDLLLVDNAKKTPVADADRRWAQSHEAARSAKQPCPAPPQALLDRANLHVIETENGMRAAAGIAADQKDPVALFEVGLASFSAGNRQQGYDFIVQAADLGDPEALYTKGVLIARGQVGNKPDLAAGFALVESAAKAGHLDAMFLAGNMQRKGEGTRKDPKKAFAWHRQAAERGHLFATVVAFDMLNSGEGTKKDFDLAYRLSRRVAQAGHVYGALMAATSLAQGKDPVKHKDDIFYWMDFAIRNGNAALKAQVTPIRAQLVAVFANHVAPPAYQPRVFKACPMKRTCIVNHYSGLQSCTTNKDYWSDCDG